MSRTITIPARHCALTAALLTALCVSAGGVRPAAAQEPPAVEEGSAGSDSALGSPDEAASEGSAEPVMSAMTRTGSGLGAGRATSRVTREEMALRIPRSSPDALRYEPGVFVQQTAHAQGSPFIRGRTGQQTVILYDGVRLNNSLFRQGPNQYFFTIDSRTVESIDVLRGSASTRFGSDAMAGVISANPIEPTLAPDERGFAARPRLMLRYGSADNERGGRVQADMQWGPRVGWFIGLGYRDIDQLRSGGIVRNPRDGGIPEVPRFEDDERTQRGTGFEEITGDARVVVRVTDDIRVIGAYYDYRQRNAPRTDQCAPPFAPVTDCLTYDEQDRQLAYAAVEGEAGPALKAFRLTLSWQLQHERRVLRRPTQFTNNIGLDDVTTLGIAGHARTGRFRIADPVVLVVRYGGDYYADSVSSAAWLTFTDVDVTRERSRGQYIDGARYAWGGVFSELEWQLFDQVAVRTGGRVASAAANAEADEESGTLAVDQNWLTAVGNANVEWWAHRDVTVTLSLDQGYRAPNLDDLTSRQQTGPGFQIENAALRAERALTLELGVQVRNEWLTLDAWGYRTTIDDAIARSRREASECPPNTPQCGSSWSRFQLINTPGLSEIHGVEGGVEVRPIGGLSVRATVAWARGEGPNTQTRPTDDSEWRERVPLSRVPPLNGTAEITWRDRLGWYVGAALRWATMQDRLAIADESDARIPIGGTPGFAVVDLRAGYRLDPWVTVALVGENLTDAAYRYHGSSVNGAGRSILVNLEFGL